MQLAEGPAHLRNLDVFADVGGDHQEEAAVGSALVQLPRGVQVAGAEAERRRAPERPAPGGAQVLKLAKDIGCGRDVGENGEIVAWTIRVSELHRREGWEGRSMLRPSTRLARQLGARQPLRLLDVGLIERVDAQAFTQRRGGVLPTLELDAEVEGIGGEHLRTGSLRIPERAADAGATLPDRKHAATV